jgi:mono/diheme cytochrome c family protein
MRRSIFTLFLLIAPVLAIQSVQEGVYTEAQAKRGQKIYLEECSKCHAENLTGGDGSPELAGKDFRTKWNGRSAGTLFELIRKTMPTDDPGHLSTLQSADLTAFILSANEFPAGQTELGRDLAVLNEIRIEAKK